MRKYYNVDECLGNVYITISKLEEHQKQYIKNFVFEKFVEEEEYFLEQNVLYKYYLNIEENNDKLEAIMKYLQEEGFKKKYDLNVRDGLYDIDEKNWDTYYDEDDYDEETKIKQGIGMKRYYYVDYDYDDDNKNIWISDLEKYKIRHINRLVDVCDDDIQVINETIYKYSVCCESRYIKPIIEYLEKNGYVEYFL